MNRRKFISSLGVSLGAAAVLKPGFADTGAQDILFAMQGQDWTCHGKVTQDTFIDFLRHQLDDNPEVTITKLEMK